MGTMLWVSSLYPRTNSPALSGASYGLVPGMPVPSTAGWPMPSAKPNMLRRSVGGVRALARWARRRAGRVRRRGRSSKATSRRAESGASPATTRWTSCEPSGFSQCSGAFLHVPKLSRSCGHSLLKLGRKGSK